MVEIQCPSCQTRYRIDEQVIPDESPTFKCSRCGHVFAFEPRTPKEPAKASSPKTVALRKRPRKPKSAEPPMPPDVAEDRAQPALPPTVADTAGNAAPVVEPARTPTEELLNRPFRDATVEKPSSEGNLSFFEFTDKPRKSQPEPAIETVEAGEDAWEVGESSSAAMDFGTEPPEPAGDKPPSPAAGESQGAVADRMAALRGLAQEFETAPLGHAVHSAGFFLALFFFAALGFGAASLVICGAPAASASLFSKLPVLGERFANPVASAIVVALHDVHADYRKISGGKTALVIAGQAQNVGNQPLHVVRIGAALLDSSQHGLAQQSVYCGNTLPSRMIGEMTVREIEFFERLGPPTSFVLQPSATAPFVIVLVDPPPHAGKFSISVLQAERAASAPPAQARGAAQGPGA